jgi:hypothetical protein
MSYLPMSFLTHIIPCPLSDSCDTTVTVPPLRRSVPVINRFCPVLGWWTVLQFLARRAVESNTFSVPDRNGLWIRVEDDLLVKVVTKHSTSDVLFPDWSEVASKLSGRSKQQCKERYSLTDTVVSADSARTIHYSTPVAKLTYLSVYTSRDGVSE